MNIVDVDSADIHDFVFLLATTYLFVGRWAITDYEREKKGERRFL